jgi:hypothetical protein
MLIHIVDVESPKQDISLVVDEISRTMRAQRCVWAKSVKATLNSCSCSLRPPSSIPSCRISTFIARQSSSSGHFFLILLEALRSVVAATAAWLVLITRQSFVNTRPITLSPIARQSFVSACLVLSCFCLIALHKPMTWLVPNCILVDRGADLASPDHAAELRPRRPASASASTRLSHTTRVKAAQENQLQSLGGRVPHFATQCRVKVMLVSEVFRGGAPNAASSLVVCFSLSL